MSDNICNASLATRCDYKRNIKPYGQACGYSRSCIFQELINEKEHGSALKKAAEVIGVS